MYSSRSRTAGQVEKLSSSTSIKPPYITRSKKKGNDKKLSDEFPHNPSRASAHSTITSKAQKAYPYHRPSTFW